MRSFRGLRYFLAPPWLTGKGDGEKVAFTIEWLLDAFLEKVRQGLNARFPTRAGPSALNLIIGDRGLLRGRSESAAGIAARLKAWRTPRTHAKRGNAYEALIQIWHYWGGIYASTIDSHGRRHVVDADDDISDVYSLDDPDNADGWINDAFLTTNWDGAFIDVDWSRFWIVLRPSAALGITPSPSWGDPELWGGSVGVPGTNYLLGQVGATVDDVNAMRALFQDLRWNPGNTIPEWLLLCLDPSAVPVPVPDENWQYWSKDDGGTRVPARVVPAVTFTHGDFSFRNGAGTATIDMPASAPAGSLLLLHEGRTDLSFDAAPAGWTSIATSSGSGFAGGLASRLYARIAGASEPADFAYAVTGADDHAFRVTCISAPPEGWNTDVAANFADIVTTFDGVLSGPAEIANPDNSDERHRLNFLTYDFFDAPQTSTTTGYTELYDSTGEMNLLLTHATSKVEGSVTSMSNGDGMLISVRLVYNLGWRFWSLDPERNNTYAGLRSRPWPENTELVDDSGPYGGDRSNASAWDPQTLPTGDVHPNVRRWPSSVLLLDDGSVIQ